MKTKTPPLSSRPPAPRTSLSREALEMAASCLKALANPNRLAILQLLQAGPAQVGEIASTLELLPHVTSEHLRFLEKCGFVQGKRQGKYVSYEIIEPHLSTILKCMHERFSAATPTKRK